MYAKHHMDMSFRMPWEKCHKLLNRSAIIKSKKYGNYKPHEERMHAASLSNTNY